MPGTSKFQISRSLDERIKRIISGPSESTDLEYAHVNSAYILGFNYGNVTNCVAITTNYQLHHAVFPVVGLAYLKGQPSDEEIQANLRAIREFSSSPNGLGSFKADKNEHLFLVYSANQGKEAGAPSKPIGEVERRLFNLNKGAFVRRKRLRLVVLNDPFTPRQVYNGTDDIFNLDDVDSLDSAEDDQFDHLIFFIHGVGGVCDARFRSCVEVVADFKKMANELLEQHSNPSSGASTPTNRHLARHLRKGFFRKQSHESSRSSDLNSAAGGQSATPSESTSPIRAGKSGRTRQGRLARRVECLPVSWHALTRRQTGINEQLSLIALSSVPKLRNFIDKVVLDALLYSSGPCYTQTIINNVGDEINRLYTLFIEKHPNFTGSVSLAGHSLGSVIIFDLLAHQVPPSGRVDDQAPATGAQSSRSSSADIAGNTNSNSSNSNNNNNEHVANNNNNTSVPQCPINTRDRCLNVGHHHHYNFRPSSDQSANQPAPQYCSDYSSLEELLKDMELTELASLFHKEHIDMDSLLLLTDFDMRELQLPLGARRKLGTYINFKKIPPLQAKPGESGASEAARCKPVCNPMCNMNTGQFLVEYPQLKFTPRCFFAFGSPTPMFLNIRGIQSLSSEYRLPTCERMLNIYHPYDPLAYRMEPLIDPRFKHVEPILVPHHRGGKRIHVQLREGFARVGHDIKHRLLGSLRNTWTSFTRVNPPGAHQAAATTTTTTTTTTTNSSSSTGHSKASSASQSMEELRDEGAEAAAIRRRRRLLETQTTASSAEFKSAESGSFCGRPSDPAAAAELSPSSPESPADSGADKQGKPLRRQQELLRSQSEAGKLPTTTSDLSSIIEASFHDAAQNLSGLGEEIVGELGELQARAALEERLKTFDLNGPDAKGDAAVEADAEDEPDEADIPRTQSESCNKRQRVPQEAPEVGRAPKKQSRDSSAAGPGSGDFDTTRIGKLNMGRRIDYVLQEKPIELFNEYIFVATSHANYWQQEDSALMILKELYQVDNLQLFDQND